MAVEGARGVGTQGIAGAMWGSDSGVGWVVEHVQNTTVPRAVPSNPYTKQRLYGLCFV